MILGLVSVFFFWTFLCPLIGLVFGIIGFRKEPAGRGFAITGLILNGLLLLIPVAFVLSIVIAGGTLFGIAATTRADPRRRRLGPGRGAAPDG
ncbi:hypothetical protein BC477_15505 [Clavibacter michiganensis subsp. michiganensis]|uniref:DUF4190 domain-containing protein n=1 Tax=Clavibacter michiganensis subsp. michiganensis TaxID=33013 RepID=A0A251XGM9_CLAMM|nr:hypothetical protein BC477_15505 [Clavibacter michiganensis subsp. michiganensis]OUE01212.1 hypothetical protein CMMCAS07_12965 [Clavibacter michiganensis subsp. michiganensis]